MTDIDWRQRAECRRYPSELWFPEHSNQSQRAVDICTSCPVRRQCAEEAVRRDERYAIVAGFRCGEKKERDALKDWLGNAPEKAPKPRHYVRAQNPGRCVDCDMPTASRANKKRGDARYGGRGRCERCYQILRRDQEPDSPDARIPAGPVREHLKALDAVMSRNEIIAATGLSKGVVNGLLYDFRGRQRQTVTKDTAAKAFSVQIGANA
jgi:hypothetical protein